MSVFDEVRNIVARMQKIINSKQAEIERLQEELEWLNGKYLIQDMCIQATKANTISELNARLYAYKTGIYIKGEELIIIPLSNYNEILKEVAGDTE